MTNGPAPLPNAAQRTAAAVIRAVRGTLAAVALVALVVGIPWGLANFVGWPLPDHVPRWDEVRAVLLGPLGPYLLLDILTVLSWFAWVAFVADLLLCVVDSVRRRRLPAIAGGRPTRAAAALLVTAIAVAVIGNRAIAAVGGTTALTAPAGHRPQVVATAPAWTDGPTVRAPISLLTADRMARPVSVIVRAPTGGVHDSLWRIAERSLGDGTRWPEIFELNRGMPQPYGRVFTRPSLIYPGQELQLPELADSDSGSPSPDSSARLAPAPSPRPSAPVPVAGPPGPRPEPEPIAVSWLDEAAVGAALTAVSGALLAAALRRRRCYIPGSGKRDDLESAVVVRELRLRHLRDHSSDSNDDAVEDDNLDDGGPDETADVDIEGDSGGRPPARGDAQWREDAQHVAFTLAAARGLGLVGEGAPAAVRALLLAVLAAPGRIGSGPMVVVTSRCLAALLGGDRPSMTPASVRVVTELGDALDAVEKEMLRRLEHRDDEWPPLAMVAEAPTADDGQLQAMLDNGAQVGVVGILLGQWLPGISAYVRADGSVSATSPGLGEQLRGARMFGVDAVEAAAFLGMLRDTEPADDPAAADADLEIIELPPAAGTTDEDLFAPMGPQAEPDLKDGSTPGRTADDIDDPVGDAGDLSLQTRPVEIRVFGLPRVLMHVSPQVGEPIDITRRIQPRTRELLVFLALHPGGASREAVAAALWPSSPPDRISNALNTSLSRLRRSMEQVTSGAMSEIVRTSDNILRLDSDLVATDFEPFDTAMQARRAARTHEQRARADQAVVDSYGGSLAEGLSTEWIETARAGIRRDALDAVASLARSLVQADPHRTLTLLEIARAFDPHNEALYRDIMRLQARVGQLDGIQRTMALLETRLAELDDQPSSETAELARRLAAGELREQRRDREAAPL